MDFMSNADAVTGVLSEFNCNDAPFTDVRFLCEDGFVTGHLAIVGAWSKTVRELALATSARPLDVDVKPNTQVDVELCRSYMYTGKATLSPKTAFAMTSLSNKLVIPSLKNAVENASVARFLDASTACAFLLIGRRDGSQAIEGAARDFILRNTASCISSSSFFDLDPSSLVSILKADELSVREEDLFRQCLAWADVRASTQVATGISAAKSDPHVARKVARAELIGTLLPHLRFPLMGAHVFARTVVPTGVLSGADANAVLMHYMAPDIAAPLLRFSTVPRSGAGSVFCWSADAAEEKGILSLSKDRRIVEFRCTPAQAESNLANANAGRPSPSNILTMVVSDQSFAAGVSRAYISTWGCASVCVGVVISDTDVDDGDCAVMAAEVARPGSDMFEGIALYDTAPSEPSYPSFSAHVHSARVDTARGLSLGHASQPLLKDGSCIVLDVDWDVHEVAISTWHRGAEPIRIAVLKELPAKPFRIALGTVPRPGGGDVDGVAVISSKVPPHLNYAKDRAEVSTVARETIDPTGV